MKRFTIILLLLLSLSPICAQQYKDGGELVKDMYNCEPEVTLNRLQKSGYDYSKITEGTYRNQDIWIVGDQSAKSFYIDKKSLLFIRMQDKLGRSVDFLDYQLFNNKPVATNILFYNKLGKLYMEEIFNPGNFVQSRW